MRTAQPLVIIRGGGELGSAIGHALQGAGFRILVVDRPLPTALRLGVAFAAVAVLPEGRTVVSGIEVVHARTLDEVRAAWGLGQVAVWTAGDAWQALSPAVMVDARMRQLTEPMNLLPASNTGPIVLGIGPGFEVGRNAHYVLESNRGPNLGQVITRGGAEVHTGVPGEVQGLREERILRAPCAGQIERCCELGTFVEPGDQVASVNGAPVKAGLRGMVRGLKLGGVEVASGHKIGDVDPRRDRALLGTMTDKAQALGRGALRALALAGIPPQDHSKEDPEPAAEGATPCT